MKHLRKLLIPLLLISIVCFGFWQIKSKNPNVDIQNEKVVQKISASLEINDGVNSKQSDISGYVGRTALEATEANATVVTSGNGENAFVTSIDGRAADLKKHEFWELDANGTETQVGAGSYIIQNNDKIVWKMNTY